MPVVTDKALPALWLYPIPLPSLVSSSCETCEPLQTLNSWCDGLPICHSCCNSPCTQGGFLCSAATQNPLGGLESNPHVNVSPPHSIRLLT